MRTAALSLAISSLLFAPLHAETITINNDPGGKVLERRAELSKIYREGHNVKVTGFCLSACTMVLIQIPHERLCFGPQAVLGFHVATVGNKPHYAATEHLMEGFPASVRKWFDAKGGVYQMPHGANYWYLAAQELYAMGFARCK